MADEYWRLPYTAAQLQGAATNQAPKIDPDTGHWLVWDINTSAWVDTGITAGGGIVSFNGRTGAVVPVATDYPPAFIGAQADLGFVEDTTYSGCFYRLLTGNIKEWLNPPLVVGTEYRTTERFAGKPVYVKTIDIGNLPNNTYKVVAHGVANCVPLRVYGRTNAITIPYSYNGSNYTISATSANIIVTTNNDASASTATALFYYTKSTD